MNKRGRLSTELVRVRPSPVPLAWRERFAKWRKGGGAERAIACIMAASSRRPVKPEGWNAAEVKLALECLNRLPRAGTRAARLQALLRKLTPRPGKPVKESGWTYYITGRGARALRIKRGPRGLALPAGVVRAAGTKAAMLEVRNYALNNWQRLPMGREIEAAAEELKAAEAAGNFPARQEASGPAGVPEKTAGAETAPTHEEPAEAPAATPASAPFPTT